MPLHFPLPVFTKNIETDGCITISQLCDLTGVPCKANGFWINRLIKIVYPTEFSKEAIIKAEPGSLGTVQIQVPSGLTQIESARYALAVMAYGLFDLVARESIRGYDWSRPTYPEF